MVSPLAMRMFSVLATLTSGRRKKLSIRSNVRYINIQSWQYCGNMHTTWPLGIVSVEVFSLKPHTPLPTLTLKLTMCHYVLL